jgi:hypothetical protein
MIRASALFLMALAPPAGAFELAMPLACDLGKTCYIQQFPDHDPGPGATDFTCGTLSYEGHDGTDFALPSRAAMAAGVQVLAAAPGVVKGTRDGVADFVPPVPGKECGNGVVIDHGQGWETQYCHMKAGSVAVKPGARVEAGAVLGLVGQSGMAEFPHMHLSVRKNGVELDPFAPEATACGAAGADLWAADLPMQPGGLIAMGITDHVPEYEAIKAGLPSDDLAATAPALVVWALVFGTKPGDALIFSLVGPEGNVVSERVLLEKTQAMAFRAVGKKLRAAGWPDGRYAGEAVMMRGATELGRGKIAVTVGP